MKHERLFTRIPAPRSSKIGIGPEDIDRIPVVPELIQELEECLRSEDELDLGFGLYFVARLRRRSDFCAVAKSELPQIAALIRRAMGHASVRVRTDAIRAFVSFRSHYPDYVIAMRDLLQSSDASIRREALAAAPTFVLGDDLDLLLPFQHDALAGETRGMGGPLRYETRDFALEIAERIAGRSFNTGDCFEMRNGSKISWRSWSSFSVWLDSRRRGFWGRLFGRST